MINETHEPMLSELAQHITEKRSFFSKALYLEIVLKVYFFFFEGGGWGDDTIEEKGAQFLWELSTFSIYLGLHVNETETLKCLCTIK